MEILFQRLQVIGANSTATLNNLFRRKVQLDEETKDVESQIQFYRGVLETVGQMQNIIKEHQRGEAIADTSVFVPTPNDGKVSDADLFKVVGSQYPNEAPV